MKKFFGILLGLLLLASVPLARAGDAEALRELEKTPLPKLTVPQIDRRKLEGGMRLLLLPDDELPVVRGYLYVRVGEIHEPADKVGLGELTAGLLRTGGTQKIPADRLEEKLANLAAVISAEIGPEFALFTFRCLREDLPQILSLLFEMLREPAFDPKKLELKRIQMLEALRRQNDNPMEIANREFPKLIYGADNVWARSPTPEGIKGLTGEDVKEFHRRNFFPDRMLLALSGDFSEKGVVGEIQKLTEGWGKSPQDLPPVEPVKKEFRGGLTLIPKSADQATILMGHFGDKRFNPDKYALLLLNEILGGDPLTSRLGKRIRSSLGLVYGIYSRFGLSTDYGVFLVIAQTQAKNGKQVIDEVKQQLEDLIEKGVSSDEMEFYKNSLLNSLFSEYEPKYNFARDEARFDFYGYPPNYLKLFRDKLSQVSVEDLNRVAQKYLHPESLQILVVGDPKQIGALPNARVLDIGAQ